jgi:ABC-2 type transport system ATP-binding protein
VPTPPSRPDPSALAISCRGVSKRFGAITALDKLDLDIPHGILLGLLGPNGAGKTTLIRILLGLTPMTEGRATLLGAEVPSKSILPRVGYMPQNLAVYTDLKVRQNLELFGRLYGLPREELEPRATTALDLVRLTDRREARVSELSGGMQRRVSLAAALLTNPDLLLLDEPTVGVDPELRAEFWLYFRRLAGEGKTIVMTTHYMEEATQCDRVALLHSGRLLAYDAPASVKARTGSGTIDEAFLALVRQGSR